MFWQNMYNKKHGAEKWNDKKQLFKTWAENVWIWMELILSNENCDGGFIKHVA